MLFFFSFRLIAANVNRLQLICGDKNKNKERENEKEN